MPESSYDLLYLMAEVSIATVALSGITMVLAVSSVKLNTARASQISIQLRMAFIVTTFSIFPLLLQHYGLNDRLLWQTASIGYIIGVALNLLWNTFGHSSKLKLPRSSQLLVGLTGTSAFILLSLNIWLATTWPYVTQLFIAWSTSTMLFLSFILEVLSSDDQQEDGH